MPDIFVLSERDIKEINFAKLYAMDFAHGTAGHNRLMLIANLAAALEARDVQIVSHEAVDADVTEAAGEPPGMPASPKSIVDFFM